MSIQKGRDLLLKLDENATGSFVTVAGLRTRRIVFNAGAVDATNADSPQQWRELIAGAGIKRASLTGAGVFRDQASDAAVQRLFFTGTICPWRVVLPDFGAIDGPFQLASMEFTGDHDGEVSYDLTLESAGALAFTAA